ncbi:MAG: nucleoside-diphosphate sugar epimerase/dehydratase [Clostridia bacterium]
MKFKDRMAIKSVREIFIMLFDLFLLALVLLVSVLTVEFAEINTQIIWNTFKAMAVLVAIGFVSFYVFGVFKCIWRYANVKDYVFFIVALSLVYLIFSLLDTFALHWINRKAVYLLSFTLTVASMVSVRFAYAYIYGRLKFIKGSKEQKRTLIVGAGFTTKTILEELSRNNRLYNIICLVDDDSEKIGRTVNGVRVVGNTNEIAKYCKKFEIDTIIFAIPSISENARKTILNNCMQTGCDVKVLPYVSEMINSVNLIGQAREIKIEDLLGRASIKFEDNGVSKYIKDKVVFITGGGGSIGSELCRQIAKYAPKHIIVIDVYENSAYNIQQELLRNHKGNFQIDVEIVSVTDYNKMNELFLQYQPNIVFHAAAHKHVPLMETNPEEAVKNNVFGTYNVVSLSSIHKVDKFIMISTDKAVNPTNVMGATKRCCEMIIQYFSQNTKGTEFAAVRFGNVLGSNGSVIPLFKDQIMNGGPVCVTHKDIIRYFMTIPEAVSLVLQAGTFAHGGEIFVLDMGEPVKILTLAENLIRMMGYTPYEDINIEFTGLRPGEKLFEELLMNEEGLETTSNNKIFIGKQINIDNDKFVKQLAELKEIAQTNNKNLVIEKMKEIVPTFVHDKI